MISFYSDCSFDYLLTFEQQVRKLFCFSNDCKQKEVCSKSLFFFSFFYFSRYPNLQKSKEIFLKVGKKYYLEGIMVGKLLPNHIEIGVNLPDGSNIIPITAEYLSVDGN